MSDALKTKRRAAEPAFEHARLILDIVHTPAALAGPLKGSPSQGRVTVALSGVVHDEAAARELLEATVGQAARRVAEVAAKVEQAAALTPKGKEAAKLAATLANAEAEHGKAKAKAEAIEKQILTLIGDGKSPVALQGEQDDADRVQARAKRWEEAARRRYEPAKAEADLELSGMMAAAMAQLRQTATDEEAAVVQEMLAASRKLWVAFQAARATFDRAIPENVAAARRGA